MIGWYVSMAFAALALVFFLVYLYEHGERKEDEQLRREAETAWDGERKQFMELVAQRTAECDTWRKEANLAWTKCASAEEALLVAQDERATLKLQLVEATKPKPRRGGTKKTEAQP